MSVVLLLLLLFTTTCTLASSVSSLEADVDVELDAGLERRQQQQQQHVDGEFTESLLIEDAAQFPSFQQSWQAGVTVQANLTSNGRLQHAWYGTATEKSRFETYEYGISLSTSNGAIDYCFGLGPESYTNANAVHLISHITSILSSSHLISQLT